MAPLRPVHERRPSQPGLRTPTAHDETRSASAGVTGSLVHRQVGGVRSSRAVPFAECGSHDEPGPDHEFGDTVGRQPMEVEGCFVAVSLLLAPPFVTGAEAEKEMTAGAQDPMELLEDRRSTSGGVWMMEYQATMPPSSPSDDSKAVIAPTSKRRSGWSCRSPGRIRTRAAQSWRSRLRRCRTTYGSLVCRTAQSRRRPCRRSSDAFAPMGLPTRANRRGRPVVARRPAASTPASGRGVRPDAVCAVGWVTGPAESGRRSGPP